MSGDFYVYVHFRKDDGLPFYVGKGRGDRGFRRSGRNPHWRRVAKKHGLIVVVYRTGLEEDYAFDLERDLIRTIRSIHGKVLTNITDGGEGNALSEQTQAHKERILAFRQSHGRFPSSTRKDERGLASKLGSYASRRSPCFDPEFLSTVQALGYGEFGGLLKTESDASKQCLREFYAEHCRFPSERIPEEKRAKERLKSYCTRGSSTYDPDFHLWCKERGYGDSIPCLMVPSEKRKEIIRAFFEEHGRFPSYYRDNEKKIFIWTSQLTSPSHKKYDKDFAEWCQSVGRGTGKLRCNTKRG